MVQDYYYLNKWTIKNNYSLSLISDIVENINTKKVFTKLDLCWSYNNIQIKEGDEWKVVFMTSEGLFELIVMFFGLTNSLAMFQTIINKILQDLINTGEVASFIDDIIVEIEEEERHDEVVEEVVKRLVENNLYIKLEKYKQKVRKIKFFGVVIGSEGIKIEKEKVKEVQDVQKFLGLANYYWQFIKDFTVIARLLHDLVKKDQKQDWIEKQEEAFKELKERFTKELVLAVLDLDKKNENES